MSCIECSNLIVQKLGLDWRLAFVRKPQRGMEQVWSRDQNPGPLLGGGAFPVSPPPLLSLGKSPQCL